MKISIVLAGLIALAPLSFSTAFGAVTYTDAAFEHDAIDAAWALYNITDDALDLAGQSARADGIQGTTAASYLSDLIQDTNALKHAAQRLASNLENHASSEAIQGELNIIETKYQDVNRGSTKVSTQLYSQLKTSEGYQLRSAYVKVRSRYVYLQAQLSE